MKQTFKMTSNLYQQQLFLQFVHRSCILFYFICNLINRLKTFKLGNCSYFANDFILVHCVWCPLRLIWKLSISSAPTWEGPQLTPCVLSWRWVNNKCAFSTKCDLFTRSSYDINVCAWKRLSCWHLTLLYALITCYCCTDPPPSDAVWGRQESLHHHHQLVRHRAVQGGPC